MKNTGFAHRFPLGLLDTEGVELSFQDLFQSNNFQRSLPLNKQRRLRQVFWEEEGGAEGGLLLFKAKLIH